MSTTSSTKTIEVLRNLFASYGLPLQVVSDNSPRFVSQEFADFLKQNGVKHVRSTPYHPSTNGLVERFIQTFKKAMKASQHDSRPFAHRLADFLLKYRISTHSTTKHSPCSLFLQRELRTRLDFPGGKVREIARSSADLAEVRGLTRISAIIIAYVNPRYAELR